MVAWRWSRALALLAVVATGACNRDGVFPAGVSALDAAGSVVDSSDGGDAGSPGDPADLAPPPDLTPRTFTCPAEPGTMATGTLDGSPVSARFAWYGLSFGDDCGVRLVIFLDEQDPLVGTDERAGPPPRGLLVEQAKGWGGICSPDKRTLHAEGGLAKDNFPTLTGTIVLDADFPCPLDPDHLPAVVSGTFHLGRDASIVDGRFVAGRCAPVDWFPSICI